LPASGFGSSARDGVVGISGAGLEAGAGTSLTMVVSEVGAPIWSGVVSCNILMAIAATVAAAASGHQRRRSAIASRVPIFCGRAPTSRRAAAVIAASSDFGGSSLDNARHAASKRGSEGAARSRGSEVVIAGLRARCAVS
jgi:hypothetical protein